jgi:P-type conjugative transfer protein TrbJ
MRAVALVLCVSLVLLSSSPTAAQWAVHDAPAGLQRAALWVEEALQWARAIEGTYNVIRRQIEQIELMVRNLQRLPLDLNVVDDLLRYGNHLTGMLDTAHAVSFQLDQATRQFDMLYRQADRLASGDTLTWRQQLLAARTDTAAVAVRVQSVRGHLLDIYNRIIALVHGAAFVQGNLDSQQLAAQQRGLALQQQQNLQALLATQARLQAQREAEDAALEQIRLQLIQQATAPPPASAYVPQGTLHTYRWME